MKEKIERWYHMGLWTKTMVVDAVSKGIMTDEEAMKILK